MSSGIGVVFLMLIDASRKIFRTPWRPNFLDSTVESTEFYGVGLLGKQVSLACWGSWTYQKSIATVDGSEIRLTS